MKEKLYPFVMAAVIISFLGFLLENIWLLIRKGYTDNRNMSLPFLWGYGLMITAFYFMAGVPAELELSIGTGMFKSKTVRYLAYFGIAFVMVSLGEIFLGFFTEKYFGFYYWDYTSIPLHITRYTSVPTSCGFALIITLFMDNCYLPLLDIMRKIPIQYIKPAATFMAAILSYDLIRSFRIMHRTHCPYIRYIKYPRRRRLIRFGR